MYKRQPAYHSLVLTATAGGTILAVQVEMGMLVVGLGVVVVSLKMCIRDSFFIFTGSFPAHRWASTVVLAGTLLTSGVLVWTAQRVFLGASRDTFARVRDLGPLELTYLGILAALIVLVGVVPGHLAELFQNGAGHILFPGTI